MTTPKVPEVPEPRQVSGTPKPPPDLHRFRRFRRFRTYGRKTARPRCTAASNPPGKPDQEGTTVTVIMEPPPQLLYKVADLVAVLRMSRAYVYKQIKAGRLRIVKEGDATFVTAVALADYVALLEREASERDDQ